MCWLGCRSLIYSIAAHPECCNKIILWLRSSWANDQVTPALYKLHWHPVEQCPYIRFIHDVLYLNIYLHLYLQCVTFKLCFNALIHTRHSPSYLSELSLWLPVSYSHSWLSSTCNQCYEQVATCLILGEWSFGFAGPASRKLPSDISSLYNKLQIF